MKKVVLIVFVSFLFWPLYSQVEEVPAGKLSGLFFMDYYYNAARDHNFEPPDNTAIGGEEGVHGLQVRRIYLTYDYRFSSKISSRLRLESDETHFTSNEGGDASGNFSMFIKDAYIDWQFSENHKVVTGIQSTPAFGVSEKIWGNRYIEKTIMDLRKIVPSRDLAISLKGNLDGDGQLKYWLMYGNNSAGKPESNKYKRYFAQIAANPFSNLSLTLYGDLQSREPLNEELLNNIITTAAFAGYEVPGKFSGGIELFHRTIQNGFIPYDSFKDQKGVGVSLFGTYYFSDRFNVFGRFDNFEPNYHDDAAGDVRNLVIAGMAFSTPENLTLSPNVMIESFEDNNTENIDSSVTMRITGMWRF